MTRKVCGSAPEQDSEEEIREEDVDVNHDLRHLEAEDKDDVLPILQEQPSSKTFDEDLPATLGAAMCPCPID